MRKLSITMAIAAAISVPNLLAGFVDNGTITLSDGAVPHYGNGGQFWAVTTPTGGSPALGNFYTFCIEENENIGLPATYNYQISAGAVAGGVAGANHIDPNTSLSQDYISLGTAFLYSNYRNGGLGTLTSSQAGQLQAAIWFLEDETGSLISNGVDGTYFYNLAIAAYTAVTVKNDSGGAFGVVALNLYTQNADGSQTKNQDQLGIVPETPTIFAGGLLLLPFAISTLRIMRKKRVA